MRWLDLLHARYHNDDLFFSDGWGDEEFLLESLIQREPPEPFETAPLRATDLVRIVRFESPRAEALPPESRLAEALVVLPEGWTRATPVCVQLASTGDEGFLDRQKLVAEPLTALGIGSVIIENPFYGRRRPRNQNKTYLRKVSDLWAMGLAIVAETRAVLRWLEQQDFCTLGVCGVSMGGAMASQAVALSSRSLAMCACIAPHSATPVFLDGVLSRYVDWTALGGDEGRVRLGQQLDGSDLRRFPPPTRPDCAVFLAAKRDAYVDPTSSRLAAETWPGSKLRWLNNGHVGTAMFQKGQYIKGINKAFSYLMAPAQAQDAWLP